jgi:phosphoserine phosphatase
LIPEIAVADAIARIERAIAEVGVERAAFATDGDGTLWTHDIGEALFEAVLQEGLVGEQAYDALRAEAEAHGLTIEAAADATAIARHMFHEYASLRFPEDRMCAAMAWCMAGASTFGLARLCDSMLENQFGLRRRFIGESLEVLRYAASRDVPIWLVSASPRVVVERAAAIIEESLSIPSLRVIAMTPIVVEDVIRPGITGIWPYGEGKAKALEGALDGRTLVAAMGDNVFDVPMLLASRVPLAIRPKTALVNVHEKVPGLSRLSTPA